MQTPPRKGLAVADRRSHLRLWLTAVAGVAADLVSKTVLWGHLGGPPETGGRMVSAIPGCLRLVASENPGIVFGLNIAQWLGWDNGAGQVVTAVLTLLTTGVIFYVFAVSLPQHRGMHVWCGLILAGAAGNLYDRLAFGFVRDVFQFTVEVSGRPLWPFVFNAADVFLVVGVAMLALGLFFSDRQEAQPDGAAKEAA